MNAFQLYNMEGHLGITDNQYLICLSIFFISYAIFEVNLCFWFLKSFFFKHTDPLVGPFKCLSQAPQTVNMAFNFDVILGYHDGLS